jgi:hypothetical protein
MTVSLTQAESDHFLVIVYCNQRFSLAQDIAQKVLERKVDPLVAKLQTSSERLLTEEAFLDVLKDSLIIGEGGEGDIILTFRFTFHLQKIESLQSANER